MLRLNNNLFLAPLVIEHKKKHKMLRLSFFSVAKSATLELGGTYSETFCNLQKCDYGITFSLYGHIWAFQIYFSQSSFGLFLDKPHFWRIINSYSIIEMLPVSLSRTIIFVCLKLNIHGVSQLLSHFGNNLRHVKWAPFPCRPCFIRSYYFSLHADAAFPFKTCCSHPWSQSITQQSVLFAWWLPWRWQPKCTALERTRDGGLFDSGLASDLQIDSLGENKYKKNFFFQWLWLCLMTVWLRTENRKAAAQKYFENASLIFLFFIFFTHLKGKQIDVLQSVRGPSGYITCPWREAPKPGFLPGLKNAREIHQMRLTSILDLPSCGIWIHTY